MNKGVSSHNPQQWSLNQTPSENKKQNASPIPKNQENEKSLKNAAEQKSQDIQKQHENEKKIVLQINIIKVNIISKILQGEPLNKNEAKFLARNKDAQKSIIETLKKLNISIEAKELSNPKANEPIKAFVKNKTTKAEIQITKEAPVIRKKLSQNIAFGMIAMNKVAKNIQTTEKKIQRRVENNIANNLKYQPQRLSTAKEKSTGVSNANELKNGSPKTPNTKKEVIKNAASAILNDAKNLSNNKNNNTVIQRNAQQSSQLKNNIQDNLQRHNNTQSPQQQAAPQQEIESDVEKTPQEKLLNMITNYIALEVLKQEMSERGIDIKSIEAGIYDPEKMTLLMNELNRDLVTTDLNEIFDPNGDGKVSEEELKDFIKEVKESLGIKENIKDIKINEDMNNLINQQQAKQEVDDSKRKDKTMFETAATLFQNAGIEVGNQDPQMSKLPKQKQISVF